MRKYFRLFFLSTCLFCCGIANSDEFDDLVSDLKKDLLLKTDEDYKKEVEALKSAEIIYSNNNDKRMLHNIYWDLGKLYTYMDKTEEALFYFDKNKIGRIYTYPENNDFVNVCGAYNHMLMRVGRSYDAIEFLGGAIQFYGLQGEGSEKQRMRLLFDLYLDETIGIPDPYNEIKIFNLALDNNFIEEDVRNEIHYRVANAYGRLSEYKEAEIIYITIIDSENNQFKRKEYIGAYIDLLMSQGKYDDAYRVFEKNIKPMLGKSEGDLDSLRDYYYILINQNKNEEAIGILNIENKIVENLDIRKIENAYKYFFAKLRYINHVKYEKDINHINKQQILSNQLIDKINGMQFNEYPSDLHYLLDSYIKFWLAVENNDLEAQIKISKNVYQYESNRYGSDDARTLNGISYMASSYARNGNFSEAKKLYIKGFEIYTALVARQGICDFPFVVDGSLLPKLFTPEELISYYSGYLDLLQKNNFQHRSLINVSRCKTELDYQMLFHREFVLNEKLQGESFENTFRVAQLYEHDSISQAINFLNARSSNITDGQKKTLKQYQDIQESLARLRNEFSSSLSNDIYSESSNEVMQKIIQKNQELTDVLQDIKFMPQRISSLLSPPIATSDEVSSWLNEGEALIKFKFYEYSSYSGNESYNKLVAWVITPHTRYIHYYDIEQKEIDKLVNNVRKTLDQPHVKTLSDLKSFDYKNSLKLYELIWRPLEGQLKGVNTAFIIPDGALKKIPLEILPVNAIEPEVKDHKDFYKYKKIEWLNDRYVFSYLPSINTVRMATEVEQSDIKKSKTFIGFGDPKLAIREYSNSDFRDTVTAIFNRIYYQGIADANELRSLPELPKTNQQLAVMAKTYGSYAKLYLGDRATEKNLYMEKLKNYDTIAFATHGLVPGRISQEAALVLTPPEKSLDSSNDGLLTASEIANLDLDSDWVVLSACNTGNVSDANGITGLSHAFFHAGAKSLLVSHWSVEVGATTQLIDHLFDEISQHGSENRAVALQKARRKVINGGKNSSETAHPMFWGGFTLVGSPGNRQPEKSD